MRLIIIDGLDGVGKDTHACLIKERYEKNGEKVVIRSHPEDDNFFGKTAKKALLGHGPVNKAKAAAFYMIDVLRSIKKYYRNEDVDTLIMVRYLMGTAYLPFPLAKIAYQLFENFVPISSYMLFLDVSPEELFKRVQRRKEKEMFENIDELINVRTKALKLATNWNIICTDRSTKHTAAHIEDMLQKLDKRQ